MNQSTPKIVGSAPILIVADVVASANHYRDRLGFRYERFWGDPPCFVILFRQGHALMLSQCDDSAAIVPHWKHVEKLWNVYFWVDDAAALYAEFQASGANIDYELYETPYGCLEFGVQDLDGYDVAFGQDLNRSDGDSQ